MARYDELPAERRRAVLALWNDQAARRRRLAAVARCDVCTPLEHRIPEPDALAALRDRRRP